MGTEAESGHSVHFSLSESVPPSASFSRSQSPFPPEGKKAHDVWRRKTSSDLNEVLRPQRDDVYDRTLPWWRAAVRRKLVASIKEESRIIAKMQSKIRTPWLDAYFVYTSSLGTHTFFMILLPAFFFFGYGELGRGLLTVLAFGVYLSSFVKDLICSPRPFAPPVTRLTIGSHHLEYGFPSTHSTNSVSIALFFFSIIHRLASPPGHASFSANAFLSPQNATMAEVARDFSSPILSDAWYNGFNSVLIIYTFSIVFGRLYTAMHSFTDCLMGVLLGTVIWWVHTDWTGIPVVVSSSNALFQPLVTLGFGAIDSYGSIVLHLGKGLKAGEWLDGWVQRGGWEIPLILVPLCLLAVHKHPQPVDDCPCFEDAIAFASVVLGAFLSHWAVHFSGAAERARSVVMPGSGWTMEAGKWVQVERGLNDILLWWSFATIKMIFGILTIFAWRIIAKSALHVILPPIFRLLARFFRLPRRRFYTPATEYKSVPSEFHSDSPGGFTLHPIPSVIDLPSTVGVGVEVGGIGSGVKGFSDAHWSNGSLLKLRSGNGSGSGDAPVEIKNSDKLADKESRGKLNEEVKHYDADVLTKVIVYAGIAILSSDVLPLLFNLFGWGVKSWVEL